MPRFQKPMRNARLAPSPTRISGAACTSTPRRFSAVSTPASSLANVSGGMPAAARMAMEMASPKISDAPTKAACFHGDRSWRTSRVRRPRPREAEGAGEVKGSTRRKKSSMIDHSTADRLAVRRTLEFADDRAPAHHADAVRQAQDLVEILADQHDRRAAFARCDQTLMHGGAGADVEASARAVCDHDVGLAAEFAREDELLRIAAGQERGLLADAADALDVVVPDGSGGIPAHRRAIQLDHAAIAAGADLRDREVVRYRQAAGQRVSVAVGGDRGDRSLAAFGLAGAADIAAAVEPDLAGRRFDRADQRFGEFSLTVVADTGDTVDFAGAPVEAGLVEHHAAIAAGVGERPDIEPRRSALMRRSLWQCRGLADREFGQLFRAGLARVEFRHRLAAAHDGHGVGETLHV